MAKNNFLLINLNDQKTKKLAETITSATSRKILDHLAAKEDTETAIATALNIPLPTVHYHLQKLKEAGLVVIEEFHYSQKGREVQHYKLANKYIIIAPKESPDIREKLKDLLPVAVITIGIGLIIKIITPLFASSESVAVEAAQKAAAPISDTAESALVQIAPAAQAQPDIALWFIIGSIVGLGIYFMYTLLRERLK